MAEAHHFLALDLGAESGRGILAVLREGRVEMEEVHRFPNRPVRIGGTLTWDLPFLFSQVLAALSACGERQVELRGVSVDTWGVDFGLLGRDGALLGNPVHYRDGRTDGIHDYSKETMDTDEIFALTAYEPWKISSLFQLLAMQRSGSPLLDVAETFLNMPDLFHYLLTGVKASEMSIANTSNLMGTDCTWCRPIIERFGLPEMFGDLVPPVSVLGPLCAAVRDETHLGEIPVIATCGHDTSAAVAAVPAEADDWAFLSCGTWSILGQLIDKPVATPECLRRGFTNEYTAGGWYLARNIIGLWLVQELRRKWDTSGDPWDYARMTAEAERATTDALVDTADGALLAPADMEEALMGLIRGSGQEPPRGRGELVRCVLESLALEYAKGLESLAALTGARPRALYMVGGGIHNTLLCQLTADACGMDVHAGADQCTALGNALGQALALGILTDREEIRRVMRGSFEVVRYRPRDASAWAQKRERYEHIRRG
jgi:rhamnulokinase